MSPVTKVVNSTKQPRFGYLPINIFDLDSMESNNELNNFETENIHPSLVGMAVDYLTRFRQGFDSIKAFNISIRGAQLADQADTALYLLDDIVNGTDDEEIISACKIVGFDVKYRAGILPKPVESINPNEETIKNVRYMVERSCNYIDKLGGADFCGFSFSGAYENSIISIGDADFLTENSLIDLKVSKTKPSSKDTLQILIYYILGLRSVYKDEFKKISFLRFFNPRLNSEWKILIKDIPEDTIKIVTDIIYPI